jgi:ribonuclease Z
MSMIRCALLRTRKTYDGPLMIGEDLMSFAISGTVEGHGASGTPITPLRAN